MVRVYSINELFSAARVLANNYVVKKDRLAIITNAGGPGVMSTDRAEDVGVQMAELSPDSIDALNEVLPVHWSHANPVDILGDATSERYQKALEICLKDNNIDGVLVILTPQAMTNPTQVAQCIIEGAKTSKKPVLASWTGGARVQEGRELVCQQQSRSFQYAGSCGRCVFISGQLYPESNPAETNSLAYAMNWRRPMLTGARLIIERVLSEGRQVLTAQESKAILAAFHIPVNQTIKVSNAKDAMIAAETMRFPVVLKVNMAEFSHKSDIGGVRLNINSVQEVSHNFMEMEAAIKQKHPEITEVGMTVEPMYQIAQRPRVDDRRGQGSGIRPCDQLRPGRHDGGNFAGQRRRPAAAECLYG